MTVCDLCKGTGKLLKPWYDTTGAMTGMTGDICFMCDGKGTIGEPMTNEEWLRQCNTEQLATFLAIVQYDGTDLTLKKNHVEKWVEWLKEKHK